MNGRAPTSHGSMHCVTTCWAPPPCAPSKERSDDPCPDPVARHRRGTRRPRRRLDGGPRHERFPDRDHVRRDVGRRTRSEEHTSELQSLMRLSYAVFCLKKKNNTAATTYKNNTHEKIIASH